MRSLCLCFSLAIFRHREKKSLHNFSFEYCREMSLEADLEECIWGRFDWDDYTKQLVAATFVDEGALLERINVVKENIGRQIRKAVSFCEFSVLQDCATSSIVSQRS